MKETKEPFTEKFVPFKKSYWKEQADGTHFCANCRTYALYDFHNREVCSPWCPRCGAFMKKEGHI